MSRVRTCVAIAAWAALPLLLAGCGGSDGGGPSSSHTLAIQSGNGASAPVTQTVVLTVRVTDDSGAMEPGVSVSWSVVSGGGSITPSSTSDGSGLASATFTLGQAAGPQSARATTGGTPVTFTVTALAGPATKLKKSAGDGQVGNVATALAQPYAVVAQDQYNNPVSGVKVAWSVTQGGGSLSGDTSVTAASGAATVVHTMGPAAGVQAATATAAGLTGSPLTFTSTARASFVTQGGGNNVPERYTSDLWVYGQYAYTGTWGFRNAQGSALKVWHLDAAGAPTLVDSIVTAGIGTVSDVEVSSDGSLLVFSAENGGNSGLYLYTLADPAHPTYLANYVVSTGLHTATFGYIGGKRYIFAAKDPGSPAMMIFEIAPASATPITLTATVPVPANYGHHDTFVRDGIAFVCAWNTGVLIYDVGDGVLGGSPASPQLISSLVTTGGEVHNAWWFHNPVTGEKKYLFIGQEGPGSVGSASSGDIHVVDVSSLASPHEVASYRMTGAGTHNFWMDEARQVLYAAYYNGGVVALDVSGTLSGSLAAREIARTAPGGAGNTYVWGVMLANGHLYASDMLSGLWELNAP
jgi:hypothetical protein